MHRCTATTTRGGAGRAIALTRLGHAKRSPHDLHLHLDTCKLRESNRLSVCLFAERSLEDHEDVLSVHRDMQTFCKYSERRFVFRKDYRKYEFFHNPLVSLRWPAVTVGAPRRAHSENPYYVLRTTYYALCTTYSIPRTPYCALRVATLRRAAPRQPG